MSFLRRKEGEGKRGKEKKRKRGGGRGTNNAETAIGRGASPSTCKVIWFAWRKGGEGEKDQKIKKQ